MEHFNKHLTRQLPDFFFQTVEVLKTIHIWHVLAVVQISNFSNLYLMKCTCN